MNLGTRIRSLGSVAASVAAMVLLAGPLGAQQGSTTGAIAGRALDNAGAPITGVEITATNVETGVTRLTVTNERGRFTFALLQPGSYT
ncbi:MAG: carboxypeptidase-like regulatory domain-containing protein, partial [Longimicrobiales bacterium]|nr:carboxypeptidase-like regulatory domain-containing protein [Longimicrobiales bacterium]